MNVRLPTVVLLLIVVLASISCGDSTDDDSKPTGNRSINESQLDLLFVIDNSGSMCHLQQSAIDNVGSLIDTLESNEIDFHMGITTTDVEEESFDPVARPGHLQSTPQPVPGFDPTCGNPVVVQRLLRNAYDCMDEPDDRYLTFTDAQIECAFDIEQPTCETPFGTCGTLNDGCLIRDFFPPQSSYRKLPTVLRRADYLVQGKLDREAIEADMSCALLAGTRGFGIERGLDAAKLAISPELTGGALGAPDADQSAPNHGFLRRDSRFGMVLITDEDDCSHDGRIDPLGEACGPDICSAWEKEPYDDANPLVSPQELAIEVFEGLAASKGKSDLRREDVSMLLFHGNPAVTSPDLTVDVCMGAGGGAETPSCARTVESPRGQQLIFAGGRYSEFGTYFDAPDWATVGGVCDGDMLARRTHDFLLP